MGTAARAEFVGAGPRACPSGPRAQASSASNSPVTGGDQGYVRSAGDRGVGPRSSLLSGSALGSGLGPPRPPPRSYPSVLDHYLGPTGRSEPATRYRVPACPPGAIAPF